MKQRYREAYTPEEIEQVVQNVQKLTDEEKALYLLFVDDNISIDDFVEKGGYEMLLSTGFLIPETVH